ncbi:MAG: ribonuclease P protein component [Deltaproteobacteria bacterium]|nr:ribonuclease P protein component [Deltaproteobacteria bacterium]
MGQYSFTKDERLLKSKDFVSVQKQGKRVASKNFAVFIKTNSLGIRRLGFAVSRKVGGAVQRNRIKRFFREFFRLNKEFFPPSTDIFILVKHGFNPGVYKEVEEEFKLLDLRLKRLLTNSTISDYTD